MYQKALELKDYQHQRSGWSWAAATAAAAGFACPGHGDDVAPVTESCHGLGQKGRSKII